MGCQMNNAASGKTLQSVPETGAAGQARETWRHKRDAARAMRSNFRQEF